MTLLGVCGAWLHLDSSQCRTGSRTLEVCPCLPSCKATSARVQYACHQRYTVDRLVCTPAMRAASCQDRPACISSIICLFAACCSSPMALSLFLSASCLMISSLNLNRDLGYPCRY